MSKKRRQRPDWTRDFNPPRPWKYKVEVSRLARQSIQVEKFECIMDAVMDSFKDDDFVLYKDGVYAHPDAQVKVIVAEASKDVMLMMIPVIYNGIRTLYCQLTTEGKREFVLDVQYPMVMGKQRLEKEKDKE